MQYNATDSAILHGGGKTKNLKTHSGGVKGSTQNNSQKMAAHAGKRKAHGDQREALQEATRKRRADSSRDLAGRKTGGGSSSKQQRAMNLRDEAWIRKEMHVPTKADYPDVPETFFKETKPALVNAVQGLAELTSTYVTLAHEVFRCTVRYESLARNVVVEGEGRSKVSFLSFCIYDDAK